MTETLVSSPVGAGDIFKEVVVVSLLKKYIFSGTDYDKQLRVQGMKKDFKGWEVK